MAFVGNKHIAAIIATATLCCISCAQVRILPLGDSNTAGYQPAWCNPYGGGYRETLENLLPPSIDFVGPKTDWNSATIRDPDHCGLTGWTIAPFAGRLGLTTNVTQWMIQYKPDYVLLQIGTNDLDLGKSAADALLDLAQLVQAAKAARPNATIYVATLPPLGNAQKDITVQEFNAGLPAVALSTGAKLGPDVYTITNGRLIDNWHPTEAALKDVGKAWAKVLGKIPDIASVGAAGSPIKKVK